VISPEGCASILWRDARLAPQAAENLRLTAQDLLRLGVDDEVVPEPLGGAHHDPPRAAALLRLAISRQLQLVEEENRSREAQIRDLEEELERRKGRYRELIEVLRAEQSRVLDRILPRRFELHGEARVFPVAVEIRLPEVTA
jgi:acetyl-CoA carboxylase alpha subunit